MLELSLMILTIISIMGAPIVVPVIIYDITGNDEMCDMIQIILVVLELGAIYAWLIFFM